MNIHIVPNTNTPINSMDFELVERKGIGHPDTMCDAIAERASRYYSLYCLEKFGRVAHHWFDKVMIIGGETEVEFGRGVITKPYKIIFAGKAAYQCGDEKIDLDQILYRAAADVLDEVLTDFDPNRHMVISNEIVNYQGPSRKQSRYRPMSIEDLVDMENIESVSNDCNLVSAYAPLSTLEYLVLSCEKYLNNKEYKKKNPDIGWDIKVFGVRKKDNVTIIANIPFIAKHVPDYDYYENRIRELTEELRNYLELISNVRIEMHVNPERRTNKVYLTTLGSVADSGDVGVVGRGNRINGLITPMRSMSIEASSGKNPIDHTGKLYGVLSQTLANSIYELTNKPTEVHIFTTKEASISEPNEVIIKIENWSDNELEKSKIESLVKENLSNMREITKHLIYEGIDQW